MERIYLDNAATTRVRPEVAEAVLPAMTETYGNASSVHSFGREAKKAMEKARAQVAAAIGAKKEEIYFTAGGSEADNWAIKGAAHALRRKGLHIITTAIEHHAVLHTCQALEKEGFEVTYLPVDEYGLVTPEQVEAAIRPDTILVSVMAANNEIGTIEPIAEIGAVCRAHKVLFHTDAVQAVGHMPLDVAAMQIDMLSLSGHKFYAPKGVGALYIRTGVRIENLIEGGAQERSRRAGTENVPAIVGMGKAIELITAEMAEENARISGLRDRLIAGILDAIPESRLNGHPTKRLPGNVNVSIRYIEGEALLLSLDMAGIAASSGSACTSGSLDPSHVLLAIGLPHEIAHGSLRLTIGRDNTQDEIDRVLEELPKIVSRLRAMSPLYDDRTL
ncbi:MAG TPA: cysteine desulfurase NifS [Candidatus Spyradocola merdavium]|nr:cysteine desulfurase NifS [Candidatus Spyradocola merdavium]